MKLNDVLKYMAIKFDSEMINNKIFVVKSSQCNDFMCDLCKISSNEGESGREKFLEEWKRERRRRRRREEKKREEKEEREEKREKRKKKKKREGRKRVDTG